MKMTMAFVVLLPCLVAMVAAAPAAERTDNHQERMVGLRGDGIALDRAKRAQEQMVFGNQQNSFRSPASAAKKNSGQFLYPPFIPRLPPSYAGEATPYRYMTHADDNQDRAGFMYASKQAPLGRDLQEETVSELQGAAVPESDALKNEVEKQIGSSEQKSPEESEANSKAGREQTAEPVIGPKEPPQLESAKDGEQSERVEQAPERSDPHPEALTSPPTPTPPVVMEPEVHTPQKPRLPENSRKADAEEMLLAKDQTIDSDDIDLFLKDLKEPIQAGDFGNTDGKGEEKTDEKEDVKEKKDANERSAEAELMEVAGQSPEAAEKTGESEIDRELLLYGLLNQGDFPVDYTDFSFPGWIRRRRRSLPHRRLHRIHRRRRSGRQVGRARRIKRDLFDDEVYYSPDAQYALQMAEEQEEKEEKQAEIGELVSYLMALYPALYDNRPPPQNSPYPGYFWYKSGYPEESYPEYQQWEDDDEEEEPEYVDIPVGDWEPPSQPAPAWEPAFYPEEVEEPIYYPSLSKRQMIPEQRLKRYFYPYLQEPYAHWGAFVPSQKKRDYDDAYWRLKDLAMMLADARQPYIAALSDYRKK